jgi:hypothetical protein
VTSTLDDLVRFRGAAVYDAKGARIGAVDEIFYDDATSRPEWVGIGTGFLRTKRVLVPLEGASVRDDGLYVAYDAEHVKRSPDVDSDEISDEVERELYAYYRLGAGAEGGTRLRKWVETEPVAVEVELRKEIVRVVREPIGQTVQEARIGDVDFSIALQEEVAAIRTETVAAEATGQ